MDEQEMNFIPYENKNNEINIKISPLWVLKVGSASKDLEKVKETPVINEMLNKFPPSIDEDIQKFLLNVINTSVNDKGIIKIEFDLNEAFEKSLDCENYLSNCINGSFAMVAKTVRNHRLILTLKQKNDNLKIKSTDGNNSSESLLFDIQPDLLDDKKLEVSLGDSKLIALGNGPYGHYLVSSSIRNSKELKVIPHKHNKKAS